MVLVSIPVGYGFIPNLHNQIEAIFKMSVFVCLHNYFKLFPDFTLFKTPAKFLINKPEMTTVSK